MINNVNLLEMSLRDVDLGLVVLVWLLGVSAISAQCSTCVSGKCHDNGECIIGCIPDYVGRFCEKTCPTNCISKMCHEDNKGVITCSDGCTPGRCGAQCSLTCPPGCVTCDRQCNTCNVTLCPEGRYGAGCSQTCDLNYEKCDRGSGKCIRCRRGYYGDNCDQKCTTCLSIDQDIKYTCRAGCERCKFQESCPSGSYGDKCHLKCSRKCGQLERTGHPCNKATGECSTGCKAGYHGRTCNYTCSEHCDSLRCEQATGECSTGCKAGYHGRTCNYTCNELCVARVCQQHGGGCTYGCISGYKTRQGLCQRINDEDTSRDVSVVLNCVVAGCVVAATVVLIAMAIYIRQLRRLGHVAEKMLSWTDDTIDSRTDDQVMYILRNGEKWIPVSGPIKRHSAETGDGNRELTNIAISGKMPGQISMSRHACRSPIQLDSHNSKILGDQLTTLLEEENKPASPGVYL